MHGGMLGAVCMLGGCALFKAFVFFVLLTSWLSSAKLGCRAQTYDVLECFAGQAMFSRTARMAKLRAAAIDIDYDEVVSRKGGMDLTTSAHALRRHLNVALAWMLRGLIVSRLNNIYTFYIGMACSGGRSI